MPSLETLSSGKDAVAERGFADLPLVESAERCGLDGGGLRHGCGDGPGSVGGVELGECRGKTVEGTTKNADIVGMGEVSGQGSGGRKDFEVVCEELASAASAFAVLDGMEKRFEVIVGALHEADASAGAFGNRDDMPPKMRAVTIQMRQDQVDGLAFVFSCR